MRRSLFCDSPETLKACTAEADVARVKAQLGEGSISREEYDKVVGDRDEAGAGVDAARVAPCARKMSASAAAQ